MPFLQRTKKQIVWMSHENFASGGYEIELMALGLKDAYSDTCTFAASVI